MENNLYFSIVLITSSLITLLFSIFTWKRRKSTTALIYVALMIAMTVYAAGYAFELLATNLETVKFWLKVEYLGNPLTYVLWLMLAISYTGRKKLLNRSFISALLLIPVMTIILHYTNDFHHLYYKNLSVRPHGEYVLAHITRGPWYWVNIVYAYLLIIIGILLYLRMYLTSNTIIRKQIFSMLLGSAAPITFSLLYVMRVSDFDLLPFSFPITSVFFVLGIYKYKFLTLAPVALEKVFESMNEGVIILDNEDNIASYNNSAVALLNDLGLDEYKYCNIAQLLKTYPVLLDNLQEDENKSCMFWFEDFKKPRCCNFSISLIKDEDDSKLGKILLINDVTEQQQLLSRLNKLACTDELTRMYNRRTFFEKCESEIERARRYGHPVSFIIFDVDYFKKINDEYGHHMGDRVLIHIAGICKSTIRLSDVAGRYGGEEFAVLLPETLIDTAVLVAERLRSRINDTPFEADGKKIVVAASFGVYGFDTVTSQKLEKLLVNADRALYMAKSQGRNRVVLYSDKC